MLAALRAGERPTDVAAKSPFTEAYIRRLARENGIPEYLRHVEQRGAATAIGGLGIGLDDAEYIGGVLWYGLTHRGGEGNPEEQKRAITDRLVRWATRDGGDSSRAAAGIRSVLDEYLAGR